MDVIKYRVVKMVRFFGLLPPILLLTVAVASEKNVISLKLPRMKGNKPRMERLVMIKIMFVCHGRISPNSEKPLCL